MFLLLDANRKFLIGGHRKAIDAKNERASKHSKTFGARGQRGGNPASVSREIWILFVKKLIEGTTLHALSMHALWRYKL